MGATNWEDEFAKYDFDLNKDKGKADKVEKQFDTFELNDEALENSHRVEGEKTSESIPSEVNEEWHEADQADDDKKASEIIENLITLEELQLLSIQQKSCEKIANDLHEKAQHIISLCAECQQPKGIRTIVRYLKYAEDVALATRVLFDLYIKENLTEAFQSIGTSKLKSKATNTFRTIQAHEPSLKEGFEVIAEMTNEEDRQTLNLRTRIIKEQVSSLHNFTKSQASAFSKAIDCFPSENGSLDLLKKISEKEDKKVNASIDETLKLADTIKVMVEDAPLMLQALQRNDTDTIVNLQKKLIDNVFKDK